MTTNFRNVRDEPFSPIASYSEVHSPSTSSPESDGLFGIQRKSFHTIQSILANQAEVDRAILFGSRAVGTHKKWSDVDLALVGARLDFRALARIAGVFEDSSIPYIVDVIAESQITNPILRHHIETEGKVIFDRSRLVTSEA